MSFVPVILHVVLVQVMNAGYRHVAEKLTDWENHETEITYENSLIFKRFLFEAFDAYVALFYLAFFERDVVKLRGELVSVFNIDMFRRMALEFIVPMVMRTFSEKKDGAKDDDAAKKKKDDDAPQSDTIHASSLQTEMGGEEYEEFDDYLEMVISFGYITLFASAYPLAAFISVFANFVEMRTDMLKLTKVHYRPRSIPTDSIGMWKFLLKAIIWLSALTNCVFFAFTSKQLMQWAPEFYYHDEEADIHRLSPGKGKYVVLFVFFMERVFMLIGFLIDIAVPGVPEEVVNKIERHNFLQREEARAARHSIVKSQLKDIAKINDDSPPPLQDD